MEAPTYLYNAMWILLCSLVGSSAQNITIGAVVSSELHAELFKSMIRSHLDVFPEGYYVDAHAIVATQNPLQTAMVICDTLIPKQIFAVVFEVSAERERFMTAVPYTFEYYKIPVVGVNLRSSLLSNKITHPYFLRTIPATSHEAALWAHLTAQLRYRSCLFVYVDDVEGQATLSAYRDYPSQAAAAGAVKTKAEIKRMLALRPREDSYEDELRSLVDDSCRVILLAAGQEEANGVFAAAEKLGLLDPGYVWIVSERSLRVSRVPKGVLGFQPSESVGNVVSNIRDAAAVVVQSLASLAKNRTIGRNTTPPSKCAEQPTEFPGQMPDRPGAWDLGEKLYRTLTSSAMEHGRTGYVSFDENGDRRNALYDLVNVRGASSFGVVGKLHLNETPNHQAAADNVYLSVNESDIVWPGGLTEKPPGIKISSFLKAVTIGEQPFVSVYKLQEGVECSSTPDQLVKTCPKQSSSGGKEITYCCYGYLIDMLVTLERNLSVNVSLHLVPDDQYGGQVINNATGAREWNGMMGELKTGKADMILAPFSMDPDRAQEVEFTNPFKYLGLTILIKKATKESNLGSFLQPFQDTLWIIVGISVHVIALVLYLIDRFSPFNNSKMSSESDGEENKVVLSTLVWFSWGILLNTCIGESAPKSFSARVLGMIWAGFAMIIVASYTANLAAFLVLDRPQASISGINDARLRNPTESFTYATVQNSAVDNYFKRQVEFASMYRNMEPRNTKTVEEGIKAVRDGSLNAFIWDSPRLMYEAAQHCDLVTAGEMFGRTSYGLAFPKDSPWTDVISSKILTFHERGFMEQLDKSWILNKTISCSEDESSSPATLGLTNMAGVFMMVAGGMLVGLVILLVETICFKYSSLKKHESDVARLAFERWKCYIQKKKTLRRTWLIIRGGAKDIADLPEIEQRTKMRQALLGRSSSEDSPSSPNVPSDLLFGYGNCRSTCITDTPQKAMPLSGRRKQERRDSSEHCASLLADRDDAEKAESSC